MMKFICVFIIVVILFSSCKDENPIGFNISKTHYKKGDTLSINSDNPMDSVLYSFDNVHFFPTVILDDTNTRLGKKKVFIRFFKDESTVNKSFLISVFNDKEEVKFNYKIENTYEHDERSFTQGLMYYEGVLYESSGLYKQSELFKYDLDKPLSKIKSFKVPNEYFAEGLTVLNDTVYQLTWKEKTILRYDVNTFDEYPNIALPTYEGWGITNNKDNFFISNGSQELVITDKNFNTINSVQVTGKDKIYNHINEMEYDLKKNLIYANVWQENIILLVKPLTGAVEGFIDLESIVANGKLSDKEKVLNGIAILPNGNLLITGKNWDKLYEISIEF